MKCIVVSVKANLLSKRDKVRSESRIPLKDETSPSDQKITELIKEMRGFRSRLEATERKSPWNNQPNNIGRNPNFRKNQNQNAGKNGPDQNITPPF